MRLPVPALVVAALLLPLAACTSDAAPRTSPTPTLDATPPTDGTPTAEPTSTPPPTAQPTRVPTVADLYRVQPYWPPYGPMQSGERVIPSRIPPPTIDAANEEGELYVDEHRVATPDPPQFEGVPGTSDLTCVDTAEANTEFRIRSGDFVLVWDTSSPGATPTFLAPETAWNFLARAVHLDGGDDPASHVHEKNEEPTREADGLAWHFEPELVLPEAGHWLLVVTAGPQWGCFLVDIPAPPEALRPARTIAEAETRGAAYPSEPVPERISPSFARPRGADVRLPLDQAGWTMRGGEQRLCVDTVGGHDVRSGEWVIRPAISLFAGGPLSEGSHILIAPLHQPATVEEMREWRASDTPRTLTRLTGTFLDAPQHTYVYERTDFSAFTGPSEDLEASTISGPGVPRNGAWVIVITDGLPGAGGSQWGCFTSPGHGTPYPYEDD